MSGNHNLNVATSEDPAPKEKTSLNHEQLSPAARKKISLRRGINETYAEYCSNTSIHGVQYLKQGRPWLEKSFWLFVLIVSIYFCTVSIGEIYDKWQNTPVIVTFSETSTDISQIPFPAVTICSETKRPMGGKGPSFADLFGDLIEGGPLFNPNITSDKLDEFLTLLQICDIDYEVPQLVHRHVDYVKKLNEMSPDFNILFIDCQWSSRESTPCDRLFTKTYTEEGLCYTFNGLNGTDLYREDTVQYKQMGLESFAQYTKLISRSLRWSMQKGYAANSDLHTYPIRVLSSGSRAGLAVHLTHLKHQIDYGCRGATQGFKLLLHSPDDVPMVSKQFVRIPADKEVLISVKPNMIETSEGIASNPPIKRKCYLEGERYLRFFKIYSGNNCELECLTNYTLSKCGCVKFSMPRTSDMPVCGADQIHCYGPAEDELMLKRFSERLTTCNCMPACTSIEYNTELSQGNFDAIKFFNAINNTFLPPGATDETLGMASLSIYFKDNEFMTSKRSQLYGLYEFIANCGGICGLFMGFSVLSLVEVFYHLTLRLCSNMTR